MSVYIKSMQMPKSCDECDFAFCGTHGDLYCGFPGLGVYVDDCIMCRHLDCPLIEVPPHGRLVDVDELKTAFPCGESIRTECVRATIDHAPTIIPASVEGE